MEKRGAVCFVLTPDGKTIARFCSLSQYAVALSDLPEKIAKKLPKYPMLPATLIGRLAIAEIFKCQKLGEFLLMDALHRSLEQSKLVASFAVFVDANNEQPGDFTNILVS